MMLPVPVPVHVHTCTRTHVHTYIRIYVHTYTHSRCISSPHVEGICNTQSPVHTHNLPFIILLNYEKEPSNTVHNTHDRCSIE